MVIVKGAFQKACPPFALDSLLGMEVVMTRTPAVILDMMQLWEQRHMQGWRNRKMERTGTLWCHGVVVLAWTTCLWAFSTWERKALITYMSYLLFLTYVTNGQMKFNFAFLHTPPTGSHPGRTELQICAKNAKGWACPNTKLLINQDSSHRWLQVWMFFQGEGFI